MDGSYLTILYRWVFNLYVCVLHSFFLLFRGVLIILRNLCEGGGGCCVFGFGVCVLCVLRSFCWEEDLSVYCDGPLHTFGNTIFILYQLLYTHYVTYRSWLVKELRSVIVTV